MSTKVFLTIKTILSFISEMVSVTALTRILNVVAYISHIKYPECERGMKKSHSSDTNLTTEWHQEQSLWPSQRLTE